MCSVLSSTPVIVSWNTSLSDTVLPAPVTVVVGTDTNSNLTLVNVGTSDEGSYSCVATSNDGSDVSTVYITVDGELVHMRVGFYTDVIFNSITCMYAQDFHKGDIYRFVQLIGGGQWVVMYLG